MKTTTKILIGSITALIGYSFVKARMITKAVQSLQVGISDVSNLKITWQELSGSIAITIFNPTQTDVNVLNTGLVRVTKVALIGANNKLIGTANVDSNNLAFPKNTATTVEDIRIAIPLLSSIGTIFSGLDPSQLKAVVTIDAFGKEYTIENNLTDPQVV